jgi:hypothetical protein
MAFTAESFDAMTATTGRYAQLRSEPATAFSLGRLNWADAAGDRLAELLRLPAGWDGHNARPVSRAIVDFATYLLPRLIGPGTPPAFIAPLPSGGLQLEWHRNGWDLEIEICAPSELYAYARELATGREWECELRDDISELAPKLEVVRG